MIRVRHCILILGLLLSALPGCAVILGHDEPAETGPVAGQFDLVYVETLRDQASLRGENLLDMKRYGDPVQASQALQRPVDVSADTFRVYVVDRHPAGRLTIFERGPRTMTSLTAPLAPPILPQVPFIEPSAVALDEAGYVYVADAGQGRVFGLDTAGTLLFTLGKTGDLSFPVSLAVDGRRGRLYVADRNANVVRVYVSRSVLLFTIGGSGKKGELRMPIGVAVDSAGRSYVLDGARARVRLYDEQGAFLKAFPVRVDKESPAVKPAGIAVDSSGRIYVTDTLNNVIHIFDREGTLLRRWGRMGTRRDEFWSPTGIFIDGQDTIYVADQMNGRIQVYKLSK